MVKGCKSYNKLNKDTRNEIPFCISKHLFDDNSSKSKKREEKEIQSRIKRTKRWGWMEINHTLRRLYYTFLLLFTPSTIDMHFCTISIQKGIFLSIQRNFFIQQQQKEIWHIYVYRICIIYELFAVVATAMSPWQILSSLFNEIFFLFLVNWMKKLSLDFKTHFGWQFAIYRQRFKQQLTRTIS